MSDTASRSDRTDSTDGLLSFFAEHPTRALDAHAARWIVEWLGLKCGRLIDLEADGRRCLVACLFDGEGNHDEAAELFVCGYRPCATGPKLFVQALAWAEAESRRFAAPCLEVALFPPLAPLAPVLQARGYQPHYRNVTMVLDDVGGSPWLEHHGPDGLTWTELTAASVDSAYDCYRRAFATVSGSQIPPPDEFRRAMLDAEIKPRLLLTANQQTVAYARVVWLDRAARRGEVRTVARDPNHPAPGLGKAALAEALRELSRRGARHVELEVASDNARARGLYERFGFVVRETVEVFRRRPV